MAAGGYHCGSWWRSLWQLVVAIGAAGGCQCGSWRMPLWQLVDAIVTADAIMAAGHFKVIGINDTFKC